jgi:hypothetical protein
VLFSNDKVSAFINAHFEPAWEMVREAPLVRIDFGNGTVVTRTLHGNILTSVCTADGRLLDALPGIYEPAAYLDRLDQLRLLAKACRAQRDQDGWVRAYHKSAAAALAAGQPAARFAEAKAEVPVGKRLIETPTEVVLAQPAAPPVGKQAIEAPTRKFVKQAAAAGPKVAPVPTGGDPAELARWEALAADTKLNETTRRRQIHELLAGKGLVAPREVLRPIYKDVLHADLDDPYLGLGATLFGSYPFAKEDAGR